jgi:L,D-transpeptidase YcbB
MSASRPLRVGAWFERRWLVALLACALCAPPASAAQTLPWFNGSQPSAQAQTALELLADAPTHGLDPRDYGVAALQDALARAAQDPLFAQESSARLEQALTAAMQRYLNDLHSGRVAPARIDARYKRAEHKAFDAAATLQAALTMQDLPLAVRQAAPALPQYERLRAALAQYRGLVDHAAWQQPLAPLRRAIEPGAAWSGVHVLAARLAALGDGPTDAPPLANARYGSALVTAVQAFQQRHGLETDGVIGHATAAALQVPPAARVRQLELALERLRSTPLLQGPRMIVVNIPEFVLRAYEVQDERITVRAQMKVIVGQALDTRTPLIGEDLRRIEFKPYWNVPASIMRGPCSSGVDRAQRARAAPSPRPGALDA